MCPTEPVFSYPRLFSSRCPVSPVCLVGRQLCCFPGTSLLLSLSAGRLNVGNDELDEMLKEAPGPINFTVFLTMFGEKLKGWAPCIMPQGQADRIRPDLSVSALTLPRTPFAGQWLPTEEPSDLRAS